MQSSRCSTGPERKAKAAFQVHFETLADPRRVKRRVLHPMMTILGVVFVGVLCGAEGWDEILVFARGKRAWLASWLDLSAGLPSADTLRRVFSLLEPKVFEERFRAWMLAIAEPLRGKVLAVDGKAVKGVGVHGQTPLHMVHVWAAEAKVLLAAASTEGAPTEPEVTRRLLELLKIEGAIVTLDANGCCRETMATIVARKADWVCALKGNRSALHDKVRACFERLEDEGKLPEAATRAETGHGRTENHHAPRWEVAANQRLAAVFVQFARCVAAIPPPPEIRRHPEIIEVWCNEGETLDCGPPEARVLRVAAEGFRRCLRTAERLRYFDEFARACERGLNDIDRARYPLADEVTPTPDLLPHR